jgi:hypothetical protein
LEYRIELATVREARGSSLIVAIARRTVYDSGMLRKLGYAVVGTFAVAAVLAIQPAHAQFDPPDPPVDDPLVVDPTTPYLSPIALPPFIDAPPSGTIAVPIPPTGELPSDIPPLAGFAETQSVNAITARAEANVGYALQIQPTLGGDSYAVATSLRKNDNFARYGVSETVALVSVSYAARNGARSELIASSETTGPLDGGLVRAKFNNNLVTSLSVITQIGGAATTWNYPGGASPQPGLATAGQLQALYELVDANLGGPLKSQTLATYQSTLAAYFALAAPSPADFDRFGSVGPEDLALWQGAFGATNAADADGDGDSDGADFLTWQQSLSAGATATLAATRVPEPSASLLLAAAIALAARTLHPRRRG